MERARPKKRRKRAVYLVLAALLALCAASLLLSRWGLSVTRLELAFPSLPAGFDGFRVVQLSDLHGARFGEGNARLLEKVAAESPDLIVLTGDFLDRGRADEELPAVAELAAALGQLAPVYFVSGNHDWDSGALPALAEALEAAGADYLRNEYVTLTRGGDSLVLAGVEDPNGWADMPKPDEVVDIITNEQPGSFVLLLAHRNDWIEKYPDLEVDIILCGHSHGGIVRLPFVGGLVGNNMALFPDYDAGLFRSGRYAMCISRGLGNSVPLPRFWNTPEIVSLTLRAG